LQTKIIHESPKGGQVVGFDDIYII